MSEEETAVAVNRLACHLPHHLGATAAVARNGSGETDPAPIGAGGGVTTKLVGLKGVSSGDAVSVGLTSVNAIKHTVQLTATAARY